jgi:hypothetical protein
MKNKYIVILLCIAIALIILVKYKNKKTQNLDIIDFSKKYKYSDIEKFEEKTNEYNFFKLLLIYFSRNRLNDKDYIKRKEIEAINKNRTLKEHILKETLYNIRYSNIQPKYKNNTISKFIYNELFKEISLNKIKI